MMPWIAIVVPVVFIITLVGIAWYHDSRSSYPPSKYDPTNPMVTSSHQYYSSFDPAGDSAGASFDYSASDCASSCDSGGDCGGGDGGGGCD